MSVVTKLFEIRDAGTFIPVMATLLTSDIYEEAYLIGRAGYQNYVDPTSIMVTRLHDCLSANDPYEWTNRTMYTAHQYIESHFHDLKTGDVIDVQFILGETSVPKVSERLEVVL
jgi:hypothetical protein